MPRPQHAGTPVAQPVKILIAVDLTEHSPEVIDAGLSQARAFGGEALLLHVVQQLDSLYGVYVGAGSVHALQEEMEGRARTELDHLFAEQVRDSGVVGHQELRSGTPWCEVIGWSVHVDAALIVVGAHTAEKPEHRVLGSTADRIVRNASCPVLVVPPSPPA